MSIGEVKHVSIEHELKDAYLDYAMSVIVGRALPDVRDGLKPVHRRILYAMYELKNDFNKPYKKSARVVGDVIGKYHPHGDTAVYDAIVRMAQDFSMRHVLIDGQGNFGSIDGDAAAAMRYTEIRMDRLAHELLRDLDKETVDFAPNYDNSEEAPEVLPAQFPNLLVNGASGIAVGMATNIPPHNLSEILDATVHLLESPEATLEDLLVYVKGPDFPGGGLVSGANGLREAYRTGRGKIRIRSAVEIEEDSKGRSRIAVSEIPYQVNKSRLIEKISSLVKEKKVDGITGIRDESDKSGLRIVIEVRRDAHAEVILNKLYALTQLQLSYGINMVALEDNLPRCMGLKDMLAAFITHRKTVVIRRTRYDLRKARARAHLLEGLAVSLVNIDEVVALIKAAKTPAEAKEALLAKPWAVTGIGELFDNNPTACRPLDLPEQYGIKDSVYHLSPEQAQAILELRLHRLTGLERDKILSEYRELIALILDLLDILNSAVRLIQVIKEELLAIKTQFSSPRRSQIVASSDLNEEDFIANERLVLTVSKAGYAKSQLLSAYQAQHRGGKGKASAQLKDEDHIRILQVANAHDYLLLFTSLGRVYWMKAYQFPVASRQSKGRPIVNYLPLKEDEQLTAVLPLDTLEQADRFIVMATETGIIKRIALSHFSRPRSSGVIAVDLLPGDHLIGVELTCGDDEIMLFSDAGKVIRFHESHVRAVGRTARGVRGMMLKEAQRCVSLLVINDQSAILTATENGYGKQTELPEYRVTSRGGQGVISIQVTERNGRVIGALQVKDSHGVILLSNQGTLVHIPLHEISTIGRNTAGLRLINLSSGEQLCDLQAVMAIEEEVTESTSNE